MKKTRAIVLSFMLLLCDKPALADTRLGDLEYAESPIASAQLGRERMMRPVRSAQATTAQPKSPQAKARQLSPPRYVTAPPDLPVITITVPPSGTTEGNIALATFGSMMAPYLLLLDESGELVFYEQFSPETWITDFKRQPNGSLTFFEGTPVVGGGSGVFQELDASYQLSHTWQAGNGLTADLHDFQILPNGNGLLISYDHTQEDLSAVGGLTETLFVDCVLQEVSPAGAILWEWRASDHIPITDTYESLSTTITDPYHVNAVELDFDGNVLISSRHLSEITKIDRVSGQIMWRLGGKQNQFTFTNDAGFSYQHDIRRLPNGNISLWDNGNQRTPPYSRAVEYEIDEVTKVITRAWEYRATPDIWSSFMGNAQRLSNGNYFLGWGGPQNLISEVGPDGSKRFEMTVDPSAGLIYRAFRFPWQATPVTTPTLILTDVVAGTPALYFSWNGATEIARYRIEVGRGSDQLSTAVIQNRQGFENSILLTDLPQDACFFRIMPVDKNGYDTRYSEVAFKGGEDCSPVNRYRLRLPIVIGSMPQR